MKFTMFNGSPAAAESATQVIGDAFLRGAARAGAEIETVYLIEEDVQHCRGCFACWFKTPGQCVLQDGMKDLLAKYTQSDVVIFGSPVYTWNMTAALKNFVDRLTPLKSPVIQQQAEKFDLEDAKPKTQKFVVISNCGFPGTQNFEVMKAVFACAGASLEIYRNCGKLLKSKKPEVQEIVAKYLKAVEQAGFEMAQAVAAGVPDGAELVSEETKKALNMELMSVPEYVKYIGM